MSLEPFETAQGHGTPTVRQQSVFIENRVGELLRLTRLFDSTDICILALSVVYSVDCAVCRMILDDADKGYDTFSQARFQISETELLVVRLPHGRRALVRVMTALLTGEVNINYTYPLLVRPGGYGALALCPDNLDLAANVLQEKKFQVLDQQDLLDTRFE